MKQDVIKTILDLYEVNRRGLASGIRAVGGDPETVLIQPGWQDVMVTCARNGLMLRTLPDPDFLDIPTFEKEAPNA